MRIRAVCARPKLKELAAKHTDARLPPHWVHNSRRYLIRLVPPVPDLWLPVVHSNCVCNEYHSARNRVLAKVPEPTGDAVRQLHKLARKLFRKRVVPWDLQKTVDSFRVKKAVYEAAARSLRTEALTRRDARISSFVKAEKFNPHAKSNPDPRMIQARQPRYNLCLARFLRPVEKAVYSLAGPTRLRLIAKGLNARQRAVLLDEKMRQFDRPVVFSLDCSRWDQHISQDLLEVEHAVYLRMCGGDPELAQLLRWQLVNICATGCGVRYTVQGGRMSGDMNTALGNCLLMCLMVHEAMRLCGVGKWDALDDGDDCLLLVEEGEFESVRTKLPGVFLQFGQELKVENVARTLSGVTFCQSKVVVDRLGPTFVRDWRKVLSQSACGVKNWCHIDMIPAMLKAVGVCELALSSGLPILQEFAVAMQRNAGWAKPNFAEVDPKECHRLTYEVCNGELDWLKVAEAAVERPVTDACRLSFAETFEVDVGQQLHIESILRSWTLDLSQYDTLNGTWDESWTNASFLEEHMPMC